MIAGDNTIPAATTFDAFRNARRLTCTLFMISSPAYFSLHRDHCRDARWGASLGPNPSYRQGYRNLRTEISCRDADRSGHSDGVARLNFQAAETRGRDLAAHCTRAVAGSISL